MACLRRAVLAGAAILTQKAASAGVPTSEASSTIKTVTLLAAATAATGAISVKVAALTEGVLEAMLIGKLKTMLAVMLVLGMVTLTGGVLAKWRMSGKEKSVAQGEEQPKGDAGDEDDLFTVTATPQKVRVRVEEPFDVRLRVLNSSQSTQSFQVMNCSWCEHWRSNNEQVSCVGRICTKNFAVTEKLEPGQAYEKTLPMLLLAGEPQKKVAFKMGFTPIGSKRTYWSNEVILQQEDPKEEAVNKDTAMLQGTWAAVSVERGGKTLPEDEVKKLDLRLTIKGDDFMLMPLASKGPEHFPYGHFHIDPSKKPKRIDFAVESYLPGMKTSTVLGIYELDGDNFKLLQGRPEQDYPTEFRTTDKAGLEIVVFQRVYPGEKKRH